MSEPNGTSKRGFPTGIVVLLGFLALVLLLGTPNFVGSGRNRISGIINNLMQLDGAKQMWALDHGRTGAVEVTRHDVAPYLRARPARYSRWPENATLSIAAQTPQRRS